MTDELEHLHRVVFFSAALALVLLERMRVLQREPVQLARRWSSNIGLFLIGNAVTAIVLPVSIFALARHQPPGLISQAALPFAVELLLTFVLLDFWRYWEHRLFHRVPLLWRVHLVHHSDTQVDVTTTERHHPFEFLIGAVILMALVTALGLPAAAVALYLLVATVITLCSHANLRVPAALDRRLRWFVVTPSMHAVHHSDQRSQTDSNFGSVLTLWDRIFGTYSDPERTAVRHYGLAYFHRPADTGLARVLQQPFLFRRDLRYPQRDSAEHDSGEADPVSAQQSGFTLSPRGKDALFGGIVGAVLVSLVMWPTWRELAALWTNEAYQFSWLVLPMVAYLLATQHRLTGAAIDFRPDFSGVAVGIIAAACWGAGYYTNIDIVRQIALVLALQGVAMSALGWKSYWKLLPVLAMLFLLVPVGDVLRPPLLVVTVRSIELFATLARLPHDVQGFMVHIGGHRYVVADECSGLSYVTLATFLGYSFGCLLYRSIFRIAALALFSAFLGVVCNVVRVNAIVLIDWIRGTQMDLGAHGDIQWIALFATLLILFYVLSRLKGDIVAAPTSDAAVDQAAGFRKYAPVMAGAAALMVAGGAVALPASESRLARSPQSTFSPSIPGWRLQSPDAIWSVGSPVATQSIRLTIESNGQAMDVVIVEALSPAAKLSESSLALDNTNWRHRQARVETGCAGPTCIALVHATWERERDRQLRHAYYAYSVGDLASDSSVVVRVAYAWQRLTGNSAGPRLIGFVSEGARLDVDELAAAYRTLQSALNEPQNSIDRALSAQSSN